MKHVHNLFTGMVRNGLPALFAGLLLGALTATAGPPNASFSVEFSGDKNVPTVKVTNLSRDRITKFQMTIGLTSKNFHMNDSEITSTPGNSASFSPTEGRVNTLTINLSGFDYGETFTFKVDIDKDSSNSGEDYRKVLFNNGTGGIDNSIVTVTTEGNKTESLKLPEVDDNGLNKYVFESGSQPRNLIVSSSAGFKTDGTRNYIASCTIRVNDVLFASRVGSPQTIRVYDGETVEISAPQIVYHNQNDGYLTDSSNFNATKIDEAMQRYVAIGISVNNVPESGDPTLYRFTVDDSEKVVEVKWRHDYALRVTQNFLDTASLLKDQEGVDPWAGPVNSYATGDPDPDNNLHWYPKGESVVASIDGQVIDQTRPGLDVRYVPKTYLASGSVGGFTKIDTSTTLPFSVGQSPPSRQLIGPFTMDGPGAIKYNWQIQYGVRVNIDEVARNSLPLVVQRDDAGAELRRFYGDGIFWFDPSTKVDVLCAVNEASGDRKALAGWTNGDGYYFKTNGEIYTPDGSLSEGDPDQCDWETYVDINGTTYHGMSIDVQSGLSGLQRPVRVLWRYGNQAIATTTPIGEFVFQQPVTNNGREFTGETFAIPPDTVQSIAITGANPNVPESEQYIWDEQAARLYPLVPGLFRVTWSNETEVLDVLVTAEYPLEPHYKHVAGAPAVSLEPNPEGGFVFKELRYAEADALIDDNKNFLAEQPGWSVLLFGERQQVGRGETREYLRVRTVQTLRWEDRLEDDAEAVIGRALRDPDLDLAKLGTGAVLSDTARYNPFVYDAEKWVGLKAKDVYDMEALATTEALKIVSQPGNLAGPVIPVNLHPFATAGERLVVAWYDDPALNDGLLWPHATRTYLPRWPTDASEGLGRIVIASQFGSESLGVDLADQEVVGPVTVVTVQGDGTLVTNEIPAEVTYNPTRIQQVAVYSQPDPNLAGFNPNEEHGVLAPSLRYAQISPRPPAVYALRDDDLNRYTRGFPGEDGQPGNYTSHPYVLVQFFDTVDETFKMRVYDVVKEVSSIDGYSFADASLWNGRVPAAYELYAEPFVTMEAGEPVIPFYPLGVVIGAVVPPETFGFNLTSQITYWEDHKGTSWSVSGGTGAWFSQSPYYPLLPDFWWPADEPGVLRTDGPDKQAFTPNVGDSLSFLPADIDILRGLEDGDVVSQSQENTNLPTEILYKSEWPDVVPVLKAGETLTFSGGEYRADKPTSTRENEDGELETVDTPGLPAVVAFASAEVVFDALNPTGADSLHKTRWTARVAQVLEKRSVDLAFGDFPAALAPASGRTRISSGKYVFNELPASLQKRMRYDPINGKLEVFGYLNEKDIADDTLTASPPAVYVLEPNILTAADLEALNALDGSAFWRQAVQALLDTTRNPHGLEDANGALLRDEYLVGLEPKVIRDPVTEEPLMEAVEPGSTVMQMQRDELTPAPYRGFGPGLALLPNAGFLDPAAGLPDVSYITVVENNDPTLGGSPITPHVIKVDRSLRYRGAIKTVLSDNVFDENVVLRHQGDFGANAEELFFEWWYRPDDGSLNVPPPDQIAAGQTNPWKLFPDLSGKQGRDRFETTLKGNPNAPEALLADTWWFVRYRHQNDVVDGTDWAVEQVDGKDEVNFTWAGAGNSDPLGAFTGGIPDYKAQLVMGWIKRVLDAVNPYEARIRDFEGDSPSTAIGMVRQLGARYEGPVALNPAKNVIENVGLIELYETILKRGRDLSIDLSRPVSTPAIANALQLAATRISDFYMLLANEAYVDALDPTIGHGSESAAYGNLAPSVFTFQNQMSTLVEEELALMRGVYDNFARPVYNRLFWNFTKGEGEAAYAVNYNVWDVNGDGFIDEDDAMILFPQGHGDAWGHYLTAVRNQYDLLKHRNFNWVSRSEFYNLMDIVIKVDFLDERKFAQIAAARAKAGSEIVDLTYRQKYVEDPAAQWQGYTDSDRFRAWGVQGWARRAGQGAYFDWVTSNALLPSKHPNSELEGIQKVDRQSNDDIAVVSANLNRIQRSFDDANNGYNPLGVARDAMPMDIDPQYIGFGRTDLSTHFGQVYDRAVKALVNAKATWDHANKSANMLRKIGTTEADFRNKTFQQDLAYQNKLIQIFGKPYEGTIGSGKLYPAGYDGPDLALHMYVDVREINQDTVPGPTLSFARFDANGNLTKESDIYDAFNENGKGKRLLSLDGGWRTLYAPTFASSGGQTPAKVQDGWYGVEYTNLEDPKVPLDGLADLMPVTTSGYTFQAPDVWGNRLAQGKLQAQLQAMLIQESKVASAIADWDALTGEIIRYLRVMDAKILTGGNITLKNEIYSRLKKGLLGTIKGIEGLRAIKKTLGKTVSFTAEFAEDAIPKNMPTGGFSVSPGDALAPARAGVSFASKTTEITLTSFDNVLAMAKLVAETAIEITDNETDLWVAREEGKQNKREWLKGLEDMVGDEPIKRVAVFREIETLRKMSDQYRALVDEGARLVDERAAYNKRVAAMTQRNRYQDMTFRVARNHALENYRSTFDLAAHYAYLAAKAYEYETNFDPSDPYSAQSVLEDIVRARGIGLVASGKPQLGAGGLAEALASLKTNFDALYGQLGLSNPQNETGKISLRTELFRILPKDQTQPDIGDSFPSPGGSSNELWAQLLQSSVVEDLWEIPEFRRYCRPFTSESGDDNERDPQPGIVLRFGTTVKAGENFFGKPLSGSDHAYDPTVYATKILGAGIWFSDYQSDDVLQDLPEAPRVYLVPTGADIMSVANSPDPGVVRIWNIFDQSIPAPVPAEASTLDNSSWMPLYDTLNGQYGAIRRFSSFRAYHDGDDAVDDGELVLNNRLVGRSVRNTQWVLIIPGITLNADPDEGLRRFIEQVSDIKLVFKTYGYSGN